MHVDGFRGRLTLRLFDTVILDRRELYPLPDFSSKMSLIDVREEFDALKSINLSLLTLVFLHAQENHAQNWTQVTIFLDYQLSLLVKSVRDCIEEN